MKKILLLLLSIILFSCSTKIADLRTNPEKYAGEIVTVMGEVTKLIKIPFTDYSFFEISDKSDNIIVFTLVEHKIKDVVKFKAKVLGYDSTNQEASTLSIIESVEGFILNNIKIDESKVKKSAELIGKTLIKALNTSSGTYLLMEQN